MDARSILAAIDAGVALIPEGLTLINEVKEQLGGDDKAAVQARLDAQADQQHTAADAG